MELTDNEVEFIEIAIEGQKAEIESLKSENEELKRLLAMQSDLDLQGYEHMRDELRELLAKLAESEQRVKFVESVNEAQEQLVCNTLGKALGFPTGPEGEDICCGDNVLESLCEMGAKRISNLEQRVKALEEALAPSSETKAAFMSEFEFFEDGDEMPSVVPWITIKEIMKAIRERAEATCKK